MFGDGLCQPGIDFKLHETKEGHNDNDNNYNFILAHIPIALLVYRYGKFTIQHVQFAITSQLLYIDRKYLFCL